MQMIKHNIYLLPCVAFVLYRKETAQKDANIIKVNNSPKPDANLNS